MRILLISSAFNSMTQRFCVELGDNGHEVAVELYGGNENLLKESVCLYAPDLIIAPFLTRAIQEKIWGRHVCIIVHPGIEGDRGPSSLDWAIQERWEIWGVTLLQAVAEMDAGPIWASRSPPRPGEKSPEQGRTGEPGKSVEDERVADGSEVAMKRSNVRGAKGPCHL